MNRTTPARKAVAVIKQRGRDPNPDSSRDAHASDTTLDPDDIYDGPSKSQRKRDVTALQKLGVELVAQPVERLQRVPLPEALFDAIVAAQSITAHEGRRRQLQFVGKLMRSVDAEPIRAALDSWTSVSRADAAALHAIERWRERLLDDDGALDELLKQHTAALNPETLRELRASIRSARKERTESKPPKHFRELFQIVKAIVAND